MAKKYLCTSRRPWERTLGWAGIPDRGQIRLIHPRRAPGPGVSEKAFPEDLPILRPFRPAGRPARMFSRGRLQEMAFCRGVRGRLRRFQAAEEGIVQVISGECRGADLNRGTTSGQGPKPCAVGQSWLPLRVVPRRYLIIIIRNRPEARALGLASGSLTAPANPLGTP